MKERQIIARNFDEYIKYNHTSAYYTYKMEYQVIQDIKDNRSKNLTNIKTVDKLMKYLEEILINNFSLDLTEHLNLERGFDFFNQNDINVNTERYLYTRDSVDFYTAIIKNIYNKYGNNFLFHVDSYYKDNNSWKIVMTDFYNEFINDLLKENSYLNQYRMSAYFWTLDSTDGISVMCSKIEDLTRNNEYEKIKNLNKDHKKRVDNINNLKGFHEPNMPNPNWDFSKIVPLQRNTK